MYFLFKKVKIKHCSSIPKIHNETAACGVILGFLKQDGDLLAISVYDVERHLLVKEQGSLE